MIEGVTVLASGVYSTLWNALFSICTILEIAALVLCLICYFSDETISSRVRIAIFASLISIPIIAFFVGVCRGTEDLSEYKATIADTVHYTEAAERFDVVGQEGKIYTLREKRGGGT